MSIYSFFSFLTLLLQAFVNYAWINLLDVNSIVTYLASRRFMMLLTYSRGSFIGVWTVFFLNTHVHVSSYISSQLSYVCLVPVIYFLLDRFQKLRTLYATTADRSCGLRMALLWFPKPDVDLHRFRSDGLFLNKRWRVLLARVGNATNFSRQQSSITSRYLQFVSLEYWWLITDLVPQLISGRLKSSSIQIEHFLFLLISLAISSNKTLLCSLEYFGVR